MLQSRQSHLGVLLVNRSSCQSLQAWKGEKPVVWPVVSMPTVISTGAILRVIWGPSTLHDPLLDPLVLLDIP